MEKGEKTEEQWKEELTPEQYAVLREKATEKPFIGEYVDHHKDGTYICAGCGAQLFMSDNKFDSDCGWPSFDNVANSDAVELKEDDSFNMHRVEVKCKKCGGHLGHLFPDGPKETTGMRYCINSVALNFREKDL